MATGSLAQARVQLFQVCREHLIIGHYVILRHPDCLAVCVPFKGCCYAWDGSVGKLFLFKTFEDVIVLSDLRYSLAQFSF